MMDAKQPRGTTKDCGCLTHDGPHWLHMDRLWRDKNRAMLNAGNIAGFVVEELARLGEKLRHLEAVTEEADTNTGSILRMEITEG